MHRSIPLLFILLLKGAVAIAQPGPGMQRLMQQQLERYRLPGLSVTVVQDDSILFSHGIGRLQPDQPFYIGSLSKSFTAAAVLQLVERERLSLEDPLRKWLPNLRLNGPGADSLKIRHLLRHTSGFQRRQGYTVLPPLERLEARPFPLDLPAPPGKRYAYSNLNYSILGLVIEEASRQSYSDYLQQHLFQPLRMADARAGRPDGKSLPTGYQYWYGMLRPASQVDFTATAIPSGFLRVSTGELGHYLMAVLGQGKWRDSVIFSKESHLLMQQPALGNPTGYGMGWRVGEWSGERVLEHSGSTGNSYAYMCVLPRRGLGMAVLINANAYTPFFSSGDAVAGQLFRQLTGETVAPGQNYDLWVRLAFLLIMVLSGVKLLVNGFRWLRAGRPLILDRQLYPMLRFVLLKVALPVALLAGLLYYFSIDLVTLMQVQPDIGWAIVLGLGAGILGDWLAYHLRQPVVG